MKQFLSLQFLFQGYTQTFKGKMLSNGNFSRKQGSKRHLVMAVRTVVQWFALLKAVMVYWWKNNSPQV